MRRGLTDTCDAMRASSTIVVYGAVHARLIAVGVSCLCLCGGAWRHACRSLACRLYIYHTGITGPNTHTNTQAFHICGEHIRGRARRKCQKNICCTTGNGDGTPCDGVTRKQIGGCVINGTTVCSALHSSR